MSSAQCLFRALECFYRDSMTTTHPHPQPNTSINVATVADNTMAAGAGAETRKNQEPSNVGVDGGHTLSSSSSAQQQQSTINVQSEAHDVQDNGDDQNLGSRLRRTDSSSFRWMSGLRGVRKSLF